MMFSIFKKKENQYYVNFEELGVDIHSHLIPNVDDGAGSLKKSIEIIRGLKDLGFKKIITTPHVYKEYYPNTSDRLLSGLDILRKELEISGIDISIECAAEYYMDETFEFLLDQKKLLTIGENHVLVEMSFFQELIQIEEYLFKMQVNGYKPILAHPERYLYYYNNLNRLEDLKIRGCKLQLNLLSLVGSYGKEVKELAVKILDLSLYDFAGTDVHNLEQVKALKNLSSDEKKNIRINYLFSNHTFLE